ncbi:MAG TPA: amino acid ABC transporter permease [Firmicutes bacterium]|nr:amino acid ABC transporter permease [Bacillota bacterium]
MDRVNWHFIMSHLPDFGEGLKVTLYVSLVSMGFAFVTGGLAGTVRALRIPVLSSLSGGYVAFIRSTPLLVQLYMIFYGLPSLHIVLTPFCASVVALTLNSGAYIAEIVRGAIESIQRGQWEAAMSLGMNRLQQVRLVIIPQAARNVIPPLVGQFSYLIKDTSILGVVSLVELTQVSANLQAASFLPLESFIPSLFLYEVLIITLLVIFQKLERRFGFEA